MFALISRRIDAGRMVATGSPRVTPGQGADYTWESPIGYGEEAICIIRRGARIGDAFIAPPTRGEKPNNETQTTNKQRHRMFTNIFV